MEKINFNDLPNTDTPINSSNLNQLQTNVENAINEKHIYSTEEQRIGIWTDNKPIYRKIITYTITATNAVRYVIPNVDKIIDIRGIARGSGNSLKINHYLGGTPENFASAWVSNGNVYSFCSSAYDGYVCELVLEYTKTTD